MGKILPIDWNAAHKPGIITTIINISRYTLIILNNAILNQFSHITIIYFFFITHEVINMREGNSYSLILEPKGGFVNNINNVSTYPSVGESRFTIFMSSATAGQDSEEPELQVETFSLKPAYPNPFNPSTTIRYSIPETGSVLMKIYDLSGREVSTLIDQVMPAGYHSLSWNPQNTAAAGIYIVQVISSRGILNQKITYLK